MAEVKPATLQEVTAALHNYEREVAASKLTPTTKATYVRHAQAFVRWLNGDFVPGGSL